MTSRTDRGIGWSMIFHRNSQSAPDCQLPTRLIIEQNCEKFERRKMTLEQYHPSIWRQCKGANVLHKGWSQHGFFQSHSKYVSCTCGPKLPRGSISLFRSPLWKKWRAKKMSNVGFAEALRCWRDNNPLSGIGPIIILLPRYVTRDCLLYQNTHSPAGIPIGWS